MTKRKKQDKRKKKKKFKKKLYMVLFMIAVFNIVKIYKHPKYASVDEWIKCSMYTQWNIIQLKKRTKYINYL